VLALIRTKTTIIEALL